MQRNISMFDRYVRLLSGLLLFGCASGMKRPSSLARGALLTLGAMKIAEGITGWCPVTQLASGALPAGTAEGRRHPESAQHGGDERKPFEDLHSAANRGLHRPDARDNPRENEAHTGLERHHSDGGSALHRAERPAERRRPAKREDREQEPSATLQ
ncbi:MAG: DUF2892 domain-containing protein [Alicyclobacillaceae bacterium]|nr:DUF2892 domain-containing protein [Alicyclobacillaceae bacterium]